MTVLENTVQDSLPATSVRQLELSQRQVLLRTLRGVFRLRRTFAALLTLAVVSAVCVTWSLATVTWTIEAAVVPTQLNVDETIARLYQPPDLKTSSTFIKSADVLAQAVDRSGEELHVRDLAKSLTVEIPSGARRINLQLKHPDRDEGLALLSHTIAAFQDHLIQLRQQSVSSALADVQASLDRNEGRQLVASGRLQQFLGLHQVTDIKAEMELLSANVASMEYQLSASAVEEQSFLVQEAAVQQQLNEEKNRVRMAEEAAADEAAAQESLADNRRRQDRLNELIREERRVNEVRLQLEAKQSEFDRKMVLYERGYLSKQEFELIQSEVARLNAQIQEGEKIALWRAELERIDQTVVPKPNVRNATSPILHQTMFKLVELQLQILASRESQRLLSSNLAVARKRLNQLQLFQGEQVGLLAEFEAIAAERKVIHAQRSALVALQNGRSAEYTVAQPPSSAMQVPDSNRKKVFVAALAASLLFLTGPLVVWQFILACRITLHEYADAMGIRMLTERPNLWEAWFGKRTSAEDSHEWHRRIALRTQQLMPCVGAVMTFLSTREDESLQDLQSLLRMAEILAERDEQVLLVTLVDVPGDALASAQHPRLSNFVNSRNYEYQQLPLRYASKVDFVIGGRLEGEQLMSRRMVEFMQRARENYSLIVVQGSSLKNSTDVEMLARHADGIIILHESEESVTTPVERSLNALIRIAAPVLGFAERPPVGGENHIGAAALAAIRNRLKPRAMAPGEIEIEDVLTELKPALVLDC